MLSCLNPTEAWQDMCSETATGAHPVIFSYKEVVKVAGLQALYNDSGEWINTRFRPISVPCGKCVLCRKRRAEEIAIRAMLEIKGYDVLQQHSFITLTVADEHMDEVFPCFKLDHRPFQLFMKRLRKRGIVCRYLMCGEYGEQTHRPHYHLILFGWFPCDSYFDELGCYHGSRLLEELWPFGHVTVEAVNPNRVFYVAGYTLKVGSDDERWMPYVRWSRRPGLGSKFIDENGWRCIVKEDHEWFHHEKFKSWYYRTFIGRKEVRFGSRYLDGRLRLQNENKFDTIKESRLSRIQIEMQKLKDSRESQALSARSLMNRAKVISYELARKSRELSPVVA